MVISVSTNISFRKTVPACLWVFCILLSVQSFSQVVMIPSGNANDTSNRKPYGCFYGYERSHALYMQSEVGSPGYITHVGFYLNSVSDPALSTPVVIKMKTTTGNSITPSTYDDASAGATTVYSGNITASMLTPNTWITVPLTVPFLYNANNLEVFVETNFGEFGDESFNAKQFRQSHTGTFKRFEFWEDDTQPPTENGVTLTSRPNIQLTITAACSATPTPGNISSTLNPVCSNEEFTLSIDGFELKGDLTYQWESSSDGSIYTPIAGATNPTYTGTQVQSTYYHCIVTCPNFGSGTSNAIMVTENPFYFCYCDSYAEDDNDTKIDAVSVGTLSSESDPFMCEAYTDYTSLPAPIMNPNQPYTIHIENGSCSGYSYESFVSVFIDYNHDGDFKDAGETVYTYGPINSLNSIPDKTFFVPTQADSGLTGMRVVIAEGDVPPKDCGLYTFGETEDYLVYITDVFGCNSQPSVSNTISSDSMVCPNQLFTLMLDAYPSNTGIDYQWQQSPTGSGYTGIGGAVNPTFTPPTGQIAGTWYRCLVTCSNNGLDTPSNPVFVAMNPFYACYCESGATSNADTKIDTVKFGSIVAGTAETDCETYTDNTDMVTDLAKNDPTPIFIRNGSCSGEFFDGYVAVYIDYNKDQDYDDNGELVSFFGPTTGINSIPVDTITVPSSVATGTTGLRIVLSEVDTVPGPCGLYPYGETEDYAVNIITLPPCISPPDAGAATASFDTICIGATPANVTLNIVGYTTGIGQSYQWQSSPDNLSYTDLSGTTPTTTASVTSTTYYRCVVTCSGQSDTSDPVLVTVLPNPVGNTYPDPIVVTSLPYSTTSDNLTFHCWTSEYAGFGEQPSPDAYYKVTISDSVGHLYVSTCNTTDLNTYIHLLDENGNHLASNNNNGEICTGDYASLIYYVGSIPETYYVVVEGLDAAEGTYTLDIYFDADSATQVTNPASVKSEINVYPNPNSGDFMLQVKLDKNVSDQGTINIYNALGQLLFSDQATFVNGTLTDDISLPDTFTDGVYFIKVSSGTAEWNQRFILQH